mmetsp:Transcript_40471/g.90977  ORF Transcript_40471/g.90977 Transcript_40471/m.90977 type:complete len:115 (-) Transcript_40471:64-408(-)
MWWPPTRQRWKWPPSLSICSPQAQRREGSWTSASPNLHLKATEMAGLDKDMHGLTNRSSFEPVASSWACAGANAGLIPERKGAGTFLDQVVVEGFMKVFGHEGLEVVRAALPLG